jgi:hypothetical protein
MVTPAVLPLGAQSTKDLTSLIRERLSEGQTNGMLKAGEKIAHIVSALALVSSRSSLESHLHEMVDRYVNVVSQFIDPIENDIEQNSGIVDALISINASFYEYLYRTASAKKDLLGEEGYEQFTGAMESSKGFDEWLFETLRKPVSHRSRTFLLLMGSEAIFAQIIKAALAGILTNAITDWRIESIPILIEAFDDYMTKIEDVFLDHQPPDSNEEMIPYDQVKQSLGL